jgi:hypothetical protein
MIFQTHSKHINEQWPDYWASHFAQHGYEPIDCIRWQVWKNPDVLMHYAQNIMLFVRRECIVDGTPLWLAYQQTHVSQLSLVLPRLYLQKTEKSFMSTLRILPGLLGAAVRRRFLRIR